MKKFHVLSASVAVAAILSCGAANAVPVLDGGWTSDSTNAANVISNDSPYVFTLLTDAYFRITDAFLSGDVYTVFDSFGGSVLTTSFVGYASGFGDDFTADTGWTSADYSSGEILLSAGSYELSVYGDCAAGCRPDSMHASIQSRRLCHFPGPFRRLEPGLALLGLAVRKRTS